MSCYVRDCKLINEYGLSFLKPNETVNYCIVLGDIASEIKY
jgi:hypothetical protein